LQVPNYYPDQKIPKEFMEEQPYLWQMNIHIAFQQMQRRHLVPVPVWT